MSPYSNITKPAVYAIFEGGGVKGSALVGALVEATRHVEIVGVGGTSAGAIVAALFAAGYGADELQSEMLRIDYSRFARRLLWPTGFGRYSSEYIYDLLRSLLSIKVKKTPNQRVTFSDLEKPLKIVAADIRNREIIIFSKSTSPEVEVASAVRMSISIPFYFPMVTEGARHVVDGGIISNFPLWLFDKEREAAASGVSVLGFSLVEPSVPALPITSLRRYAGALIDTVMKAHRKLLDDVQRGRRRANVVKIPTGTVKATDFDIRPETVHWLYQQGEVAAKLFFSTQSVAAPELVCPGVDCERGIKNIAARSTEGTVDYGDLLKEIIRLHIYRGGSTQDAGTEDEVLVRYYVDLMEAAMNTVELKLLSEVMCRLIKQIDPGRFDVVCGIKMGNPLLAAEVAKAMGKRLVLAKEIFTPRGGYPFDGVLEQGEAAILVDDVASDGRFLGNAVGHLRTQGVRLAHVFALVDRVEGNSKQVLESEGCSLYSMLHLSDEDLHELAVRET